MKEYWIVKPDDIKNISEDSLNFTDLAKFRHGDYFEKHRGAYYYSTDKMAHISLLDTTSELSSSLVYDVIQANYPYDGLDGARTTVDLLCDATEAKREGASEDQLRRRLDLLTQGAPSENQLENLKTWTMPREEWRKYDVYFIVRDGQGLVNLTPQGESSPVLGDSEYVFQLTEDGNWRYGTIGTGMLLVELSEIQQTLTPALTDELTYQIIRAHNLTPERPEQGSGFVAEFLERAQQDELMVGQDGQMAFDFGPDFVQDFKAELQKLQLSDSSMKQ
jgi:hypothetical protein